MSIRMPNGFVAEYPFAPKRFSTKDGELSYLDEGDGPAIIMFHGNPTWSFFYRNVIQELSSDYRCIAMDHLGCGLSDKPQDFNLYSLSQHIDRAEALIKHLELKSFVVLVHDWGGPIGLGTAARLHSMVKGLAITNTAAFPFPRIPRRIALCRWPIVGSFAVRWLNAFVGPAKTMTTVKPLSPLIKEGFSFPYDSYKNRIAIDGFVKDIPMNPKHLSYSTLKEIENSLKLWENIPVALFWGMKDWCFHPVLLDPWKDYLPHGVVHRYKKAGHYLFEDSFDDILPDLKTELTRMWSSIEN